MHRNRRLSLLHINHHHFINRRLHRSHLVTVSMHRTINRRLHRKYRVKGSINRIFNSRRQHRVMVSIISLVSRQLRLLRPGGDSLMRPVAQVVAEEGVEHDWNTTSVENVTRKVIGVTSARMLVSRRRNPVQLNQQAPGKFCQLLRRLTRTSILLFTVSVLVFCWILVVNVALFQGECCPEFQQSYSDQRM